MYLDAVSTKFCDPRPPGCSCKEMLNSVLTDHPYVTVIQGYFGAKPYIAGCRCYLGSAARHGFNNVIIDEDDVRANGNNEQCIRRQTFDENTYVEICEELQKYNCWEIFATIYREDAP